MGNAIAKVTGAVTGLAGKLLGVEQPKMPEVAAPTPPTAAETPSVATPNVQAAAQAQRKRERTASGRAATQLSGGTATSESSVGTKKLLGQ